MIEKPLLAVAAIILVWKSRAGASVKQAAEQLRPADFYRGGRDWLPNADPALVGALETFMQAIADAGGRAFISTDAGALGRDAGSKTSQHYTDPGKPFTAADLIVLGIDHKRAYDIARGLKLFSGIGAYPDWNQGPGLHLDMRPDRTPDNPATWAGLLVDDGHGKFKQSTGFAIDRAFA